MKPKTISSVGPNQRSSVSQKGVGGLGGSARMLTLFLSSVASRLSLANDGRWVRKFFALGWPDPALTGVLVVPVMESPVAVMLTTFPPLTSSRKRLYGMVTEAGWLADWMMLLTMMLSRSSPKMNTQKRRQRIGLYPTTLEP